MPQTPRLGEPQIEAALATLPGWARRGGAIEREFTLASFVEAIRFVGAVAEEAERLEHHPDIDIRYRRVTMRLSTHASGGITALDVELARRIDFAAAR
jgi:4a-hydroxytetrahydrobiopterin dehydratase